MRNQGLHVVEKNTLALQQTTKTADKYTPEMREKIAGEFENHPNSESIRRRWGMSSRFDVIDCVLASNLRSTRRHSVRLGYRPDGFGIARAA